MWGGKMKTITKLLATAGALAGVAAASPAFAGGTDAGATITNNVTVLFKVGGVDQTQQTAQNQFVVDRKIMFTVAESGSADTSVTPGSTLQVTTFTVTNTSNDVLSVKLTAANTATAKRGTDTYNVSNFQIWVDAQTTGQTGFGVWDAADTNITATGVLASIPEDGSKTVFVRADVPVTKSAGVNLVTDDVAAVRLQGQAWDTGTSAAITTAATNTAGVDNVLAETSAQAGTTNNDGIQWDDDGYRVATAVVTVNKYSKVISDPVSGTTNPKMIPGAIVEYCIKVANSSTVQASGIKIGDLIPANTTYETGTIYMDSTVSAQNECSGGTLVSDATNGTTDLDGYYTNAPGNRVEATMVSVLASSGTGTTPSAGLRFRVKIVE
jgi:uncharacterized repeat protein (TIGR01451 family)